MTWQSDPPADGEHAPRLPVRVLSDDELRDLLEWPDPPGAAWSPRMPAWAWLTVTACAVQVLSAAGVLWVVLAERLC